MKTNVTIIRKMGNFAVKQRTQDGMFNATELLKQWNEASGMKKELKDFFENKSTEEFIEALILEENLNRGNYPYLKTRGKNGGTWMHPILFIDFAMWLNPKFKVKVLKFVYDELIKHRHEAGDNYLILTSALKKIVHKSFLPVAIQNVAKAINFIVYNDHKAGIRNTEATSEDLKKLADLEIKITELINDGFITNYTQLMNYLRKQWTKEHQPKILSN